MPTNPAPGAPASAFELQGHRGARGLFPENTLSGFAKTLSIGVSAFELDVAMTGDGVLVVSHDSALNPDITRGPDGRFLDARGPAIQALTFEELGRYDVGRLRPGTAYAARFPFQQPIDGERIPALADVFELVRTAGAAHVRITIEIKLTPHGDDTPDAETFAAAVASAVRAAGMSERVIVESFDWRAILAIKRIAPKIARALLSIESAEQDTVQRGRRGPSPWTAGFAVGDFAGSLPRMVAAAGGSVWTPHHGNVDAAAMAQARAAGLRVIPWTVNEAPEMIRLIELGVAGLISDYPDRLRAVMAARGMALPPSVGRD